MSDISENPERDAMPDDAPYDISIFGVVIGTANGDNSTDAEVEVKFYNFKPTEEFTQHIPACDALGIDFATGFVCCYSYQINSRNVKIDTAFFLQLLSVAVAGKSAGG